MFKIKSISLNNIDVYSFYDDYTIVFGPNNVGKSVLFNIIYYMLGSSKGGMIKAYGNYKEWKTLSF